MGNVFPSQDSSFSILEPLLCWLISSNIEIPCDFWYIAEILSRVDGDIQEFLWGFPSLRGADERRRGGGLEFFYPSHYISLALRDDSYLIYTAGKVLVYESGQQNTFVQEQWRIF